MNFSECVTIVLDLVKRPDKLTAAEMAVNSALSKAILKAEYTQDLVETSIPIDSSKYAQTIDLTTLSPQLTRFRKWKYVKQPGAYRYLEYLAPDKVFQPGSFMQNDCYYMAGANLNIIPSSTSATLEVGYYSYAPAMKNNETFWLLDLCPYAIIHEAAAILFESIGDSQSAAGNRKTGQDLLKVMEIDIQHGYAV